MLVALQTDLAALSVEEQVRPATRGGKGHWWGASAVGGWVSPPAPIAARVYGFLATPDGTHWLHFPKPLPA